MKKKERNEEVAKAKDYMGFFTELGRETDRGAALLAGALLDNCLAELLEAFLIKDSLVKKDSPTEVEKLLYEPNAPLGTFSARLRASYCLGLISIDDFKDVELIKDIRNRFAHRLHGTSFTTPAIHSMCGRLRMPRRLGEVIGISESVPARVQFSWAITMLVQQFGSDALRIAAEQRRRSPPTAPINVQKA